MDLFETAPVVAVLRGITPDEAAPVSDALVDAGIKALEVTLDSPDPLLSLRLLRERHGGDAIIAAGTVLKAEDVAPAAQAGAQWIVAPNFSASVVAASREAGLPACPGVATPSEAFAALDAGADMLKLFPGDLITPPVLKGLRAVLPNGTCLMVTGGVSEANIPGFLAAGANGLGIGSALFAPGKPAAQIGADAARFLAIAREARE
ncbi:MAG: 2-dehydro-3-deoxy-6-phosphogalactonate aldolase [Pseudomonadota bacterium]